MLILGSDDDNRPWWNMHRRAGDYQTIMLGHGRPPHPDAVRLSPPRCFLPRA